MTKLSEFAKQSRYLNWNDSEFYNIGLIDTFADFVELDDVRSETFDSDQFEIPIFLFENKEVTQSILATKSKLLLNDLINFWAEQEALILRVHKKGTGFRTKYTVTSTSSTYDKATGKIVKQPAKK